MLIFPYQIKGIKMKFTEVELSILGNRDFSYLTSSSVRRTFINGDYETIIKDGVGNFDYNYDVSNSASDLERANGNASHYDLSWEELLETLDYSDSFD